MRNWFFLIMALVSILLYQNCSATHENIDGATLGSGNSTTVDDVNMVLSLAAFQNTVFPITQEAGSCVTCHGVDQQPLHSLPDATPELEPEERAALAEWIQRGALNNES